MRLFWKEITLSYNQRNTVCECQACHEMGAHIHHGMHLEHSDAGWLSFLPLGYKTFSMLNSTIVVISTFMSGKNSILGLSEHLNFHAQLS